MTSGGLPATWGAFCLIQSPARRLDSSVPARSSNTLTLKPPSAVRTRQYDTNPDTPRINCSTSSVRRANHPRDSH